MPVCSGRAERNGLQGGDARLLEFGLSMEALKLQILSATAPQQYEKMKNLLLSIASMLRPNLRRVEDPLLSFVHRVVDLAIHVLALFNAMQDIPYISIGRFYELLKDVKTFVVSTNRRKSYPGSIFAFRKTVFGTSRVLEQRFLTVIDGLEILLSNVNQTPMERASDRRRDNALSNFFSHARDFTMNKTRFYNGPVGDINVFTTHTPGESFSPTSYMRGQPGLPPQMFNLKSNSGARENVVLVVVAGEGQVKVKL